MRTGFVAALALSAMLLGGCSEGYRVLVRFDPPELVEALEWIEVALVDDCGAQPGDGSSLVGARRRFEVRRGEAPPALGEVEPGEYGVAVRGRDAACQAKAAGCSVVRLRPDERGVLVVTARPVGGPGCDPGERCRDGACIADGGGDGDGDVDGDGDADGDAAPDGDEGGPEDAESPCDCRIDGACHRAGEAREGSPCEACLPEVDPEGWSEVEAGEPCDSSGNAGICRTGPLGRTSCCTGCWLVEGGVCVPGTMDVACGDRGAECDHCASPEICLPIFNRCGAL